METKTFRIHVGAHYTHTIECASKEQALQMAWDEIKDGYTYGWKDKVEFKAQVFVEEV